MFLLANCLMHEVHPRHKPEVMNLYSCGTITSPDTLDSVNRPQVAFLIVCLSVSNDERECAQYHITGS